MTDKTDKIREFLKEADEYDKHIALEAVVEECEAVSMVNGRGRLVNTHDLLDIIAQELDVEEG